MSLKRGKFISQIYQKNPNVYSLEATPMHFSDVGLFVIRAQANPNGVHNVLESIAGVLKSFDNLSEDEFSSYKNLLWQQIDHYLSHRDQRVHEILKQSSLLGQIKLKELKSDLNSMDLNSFKNFVKNLTQRKTSFVLETPSVQGVPSLDQIKKMFK